MIEPLEHRSLLSGVVTVTTNYGPGHIVRIQGDDAANEVALYGNFSNGYEEEMSYDSLVVYGGGLIVDGVEIPLNKQGFRAISSAGVGDVKTYSLGGTTLIDLGGGDDALLMRGDRDNGFAATDIFTGDGNDRITIDGGFDRLSVDAGSGNDRVSIRTQLNHSEGIFGSGVSGIVGDLNVFTGPGRDRVLLDSDDTFLVRGRLRIVDNSGPTTIGMHAVRAKRGATVATGNAADSIVLNACTFRLSTVFSTRGGDDFVRLIKTRLSEDILLTGAGRDVVQSF